MGSSYLHLRSVSIKRGLGWLRTILPGQTSQWKECLGCEAGCEDSSMQKNYQSLFFLGSSNAGLPILCNATFGRSRINFSCGLQSKIHRFGHCSVLAYVHCGMQLKGQRICTAGASTGYSSGWSCMVTRKWWSSMWSGIDGHIRSFRSVPLRSKFLQIDWLLVFHAICMASGQCVGLHSCHSWLIVGIYEKFTMAFV